MPWYAKRQTWEGTLPEILWERRELLKAMSGGTGIGFLAGGVSNAAAQQVKWSEGTEPPKLTAPPNACDCHHHIYDSRYPVDPKAVLRPGDALVEDYRAFQKRIGTSRNVVVTPSTYGTDNRASLPLSKRVNELGWHIQINAPAAKIIEIMPILEKVPTPIVFDHLDHIPEPEGVNHPLFAQVRALIDKGKTWVKLSGAYADTKVGPPTYADSTAVAQAYAKAAPERCVWGSDWPHPSEREKKPDDAVLFDLLLVWAPGEKVRHRILVENPEVLYDYPKSV